MNLVMWQNKLSDFVLPLFLPARSYRATVLWDILHVVCVGVMSFSIRPLSSQAGLSGLHWASLKGHPQVAESLLYGGAFPNLEDNVCGLESCDDHVTLSHVMIM